MSESTTITTVLFAASANAPTSMRHETISNGKQSTVFRVWRDDGLPIVGRHDTVAVKVYHNWRPVSHETLLTEYRGLEQLHQRLRGHTIAGWSLIAPEPLKWTDEPASIVMTVVKGSSLERLFHCHPEMDPANQTAQATLFALRTYWQATSSIYGDIHLRNILCDPQARTLAFIDPGNPSELYHCEGVDDRWAPMSRDLAYLSYATACSLRRTRFRLEGRKRQLDFVDALLGEYLMTLNEQQQKEFLGEVHLCAQRHLKTMMRVGFSAAGLWRRFVRWRADVAIGRILKRHLASTSSNQPATDVS